VDVPDRHLGAATCGVWTLAAALRAGLTEGEVRGRVTSGQWRRLLRGVFTDGGTAVDAQQRAWAAVLAVGPGSVAAGRTAARLHGLPLVDDDDPSLRRYEAGLDEVVAPTGRRGRGGLRVHCWPLAPDEVVSRQRCPLTSPLRTVVDLAAVLRPDALQCVVDQALARQLVGDADLRAAVERFAGRRGNARLRDAVARADPRAESPFESLARLAVLPVLPGLVSQYEVRGRAGLVIARVDLADPRVRLGVEADGARWHSGPRRTTDIVREEALRAAGWEVVRVSWHDVRTRPDEVRRRVAAAQIRQARRAA
jgi:very-short-patch-repair endonuclease